VSFGANCILYCLALLLEERKSLEKERFKNLMLFNEEKLRRKNKFPCKNYLIFYIHSSSYESFLYGFFRLVMRIHLEMMSDEKSRVAGKRNHCKNIKLCSMCELSHY